jgi:hypothetical protein
MTDMGAAALLMLLWRASGQPDPPEIARLACTAASWLKARAEGVEALKMTEYADRRRAMEALFPGLYMECREEGRDGKEGEDGDGQA